MELIFARDEKFFFKKMGGIAEEAAEAYQDYFKNGEPFQNKARAMQFLWAVYKFSKEKNEAFRRTSALLQDLRNIAETGEIYYMFLRDRAEEATGLKEFMTREPENAIDQIIFAGMILEYYYRVFEKPIKPQWYTECVQKNLRRLMEVKSKKINESIKLFSDRPNMLPVKIKRMLDAKIVGQNEAKKAIAMAVHRFYNYGDRTPILMEGPTGSGKTLMFETLAANPELKSCMTFYSYTATQATPNGYSGDNIEDIFKGFSHEKTRNSMENNVFTSKGVIFIDEIDKLMCYSNTDSSGEDVNQTILHQMLTVISGSTISGVDSKDILFLFAGAFENLEEERNNKKKSKHQIGFAAPDRNRDSDTGDRQGYDLRQELIDRGCSRQFIARIGTFVHLERLGREEIREILMNDKHGVLKKKQQQMKQDGLKLVISSEDVIDKMVDMIMENNMGARGSMEMLSSLIDRYTFEMLENGDETMVLHPGVFRGEKPYFISHRLEAEDANFIRAYYKV